MDTRKIEEKQFHDKLRTGTYGQRWSPELEKVIKENPLWANMKYYSIERKSRDFVLNWLTQKCLNRKILDYCCGNGEDAIFVAKNSAEEVIGIEISEVSINNCIARAEYEEISDIASFQVMDAEDLQFNDNTFDLVTEYGCLHHVDLEKAFYEIARVLKPNGRAICNEALGHNKVIQLYRRLTPHLRTKYEVEHILKKDDLEWAKRYFNKVECSFFFLSTLFSVPFRNLPGFGMLLRTMESKDSTILKLPILKWQAWQVVFILSEPKKAI